MHVQGDLFHAFEFIKSTLPFFFSFSFSFLSLSLFKKKKKLFRQVTIGERIKDSNHKHGTP